MSEEARTKAIKWAQGLFLLNAAIWFVLGVLSFARLGGNGSRGVTELVVAILMFGNSGAMALSGAVLGRRRLHFYLFALAVLAVNLVLTFTDQVGVLDWITLAIDLVLVGILVAARRQFYGEQ